MWRRRVFGDTACRSVVTVPVLVLVWVATTVVVIVVLVVAVVAVVAEVVVVVVSWLLSV